MNLKLTLTINQENYFQVSQLIKTLERNKAISSKKASETLKLILDYWKEVS